MAGADRSFGRLGKDAELIAFFLVLGLAFLAGGIAAIVDGLPYLVLERGFTQVIIGTTIAVGGVILLAMCWLLVELRRVRKALNTAATLATPVVAALPERVPNLAVPVAVGAAAGATAAALAAAEGSTDSQAASAAAGQPDLFGSLVAARMERDEPAPGWAPAAGRFAPEPPTLPGLDDVSAQAPEPVLPPAGSEEHAPLAAAWPLPPVSRDAEVRDGVLPPAAGPESAAEPAPSVEAVSREAGPDEEEVGPASGLEDLRQSLEDRLRQLDLADSGAGELHREADGAVGALERAGAWMERPRDATGPAASFAPSEPEGRDDAFRWGADVEAESAWTVDLPSVSLPSVALPAADAQPEGSLLASRKDDEEGVVGVAEREPEMEPVAAEPEATTVARDVEPEPEALPEAPVADSPAQPEASDEGVVGAYQVGDTYFTIYADGSIQAQTPDGDYSFASMEELKLFLASERNRLGV